VVGACRLSNGEGTHGLGAFDAVYGSSAVRERLGGVGSGVDHLVEAGACRRRCRTHYLRNLLTKVPKSSQPWVATLVRTIFDQPAAEEVHGQHARVVDNLEAKHPDWA
jgi:hypothetical protein